jgi:hypothetical protein
MKLLAAFPLILVVAVIITCGFILIWNVAATGWIGVAALVFTTWFVVGTLYLITQNQ